MIQINPIGVIKVYKNDLHKLIIDKRYEEALKGIENYKKLRILFWMSELNKKDREILLVHPHGNVNNKIRGVFSTHSPVRPNPIGVTTVDLIKRENNILIVKGLDAFDETPLIDIKSD